MNLKIFIFFHCVTLCFCAREIVYSALNDEEYDIILKLIRGTYDVPVKERTNLEKAVLRKYQRWKKDGKNIFLGSSEKAIYVDGKKILRKKERDNLINHIEKAAKDPGVQKLTDRIKTHFISCSERHVKTSRSDRNYIKVNVLISAANR